MSDLLTVAAGNFTDAGATFQKILSTVNLLRLQNEVPAKEELTALQADLVHFGGLLSYLNLAVTSHLCEDLRRRLEHVDMGNLSHPSLDGWSNDWMTIANDIGAMQSCFGAELRQYLFLFLSLEESRRYRDAEPMGEKVSDAFPSAQFDLKEASKGLAVGMSTSTVLHLMRALEIGLGALASCLSVSFEHKNWEVIIAQCEKAIRTKFEGNNKPPDWKVKEQVLAEIAKDFRYLKNAWRNHVVHAREKYAQSEAASIFRYVSDFFNALVKADLRELVNNAGDDPLPKHKWPGNNI